MKIESLNGLWSLTNRELKKWYKNPILLVISLIQPVLWLVLFGKSMNFASLFSSYGQYGLEILKNIFGTTNYFSYLAVSMLSFIVLFTSMQSGMSIVWDRRLGFLSKLLTTPVSKGVILFSKIFNAVIRSLVQALIIFIIALLLGMTLSNYSIINIIIVFATLALMSIGFSSLFLMLALRSRNWETQMAIINLLGLPLMFASNSFYPISMIPSFLKPIVYINPITYVNDINRYLLLGISTNLVLDYIYLGIFVIVFSVLGIILSWRYLYEA